MEKEFEELSHSTIVVLQQKQLQPNMEIEQVGLDLSSSIHGYFIFTHRSTHKSVLSALLLYANLMKPNATLGKSRSDQLTSFIKLHFLDQFNLCQTFWKRILDLIQTGSLLGNTWFPSAS